jgi:DNA-binding SARP family transcriptional activator
MTTNSERLVRLYLPLLGSADAAVRRQAAVLFLVTYGPEARTFLRPLLRDNDPSVREMVHVALDALASIGGLDSDKPGELYIQCLGKLQTHINGHVLALENWERTSSAKAGWQKVRRLFAYLVHCGRRGASRLALMEAVWGAQIGQSSLSRTLAALQQTLAHVAGDELAHALLTVSDDHCMLNPDLYHTDAEQLQSTYQLGVRIEELEGLQAAAPLYAQVLDLYGGPYLTDIGRASWAQERRDLLASHFINSCERMAELAFNSGRYRDCVELCRQALDADMTADEVTVWLLRAYAALGRNAELEWAYAAYLRTNQLAHLNREGSDDPVMTEYQLLARSV